MSTELQRDWRPLLRPGVVIAPADSGRWQVRWDFDELTYLVGSAWSVILPWLVPLLDGTRTTADLLTCRPADCTADQALDGLQILQDQGFLQEAGELHVVSALDVALRSDTADATALRHELSETEVVVYGRSLLSHRLAQCAVRQGFSSHCINGRLQLPSSGRDCRRVPVVIETDWNPRELTDWNAQCLDQRQSWLLCAAWNSRVLIGPMMIPHETACYECHRRRLASHRRHIGAHRALDEWLRQRTDVSARLPEEPLYPALADLAAAWAILELSAWVTKTRTSRIQGRVIVFHPSTAELKVETVLRIPWCNACAGANPELRREPAE